MTPRKQKALQALLVCRTKTEAAKAAGVGISTLRSYLRDKEFSAEYKRAVAELMEDAARQAQQAIEPALSALQGIVENTDENAQARIGAARSILEYSLKLVETTDILTRLGELEQSMLKEDRK